MIAAFPTHHFLAFVVQCRGGLIQEQNGRVVQDRASDGNTLKKRRKKSTRAAQGGDRGWHGRGGDGRKTMIKINQIMCRGLLLTLYVLLNM